MPDPSSSHPGAIPVAFWSVPLDELFRALDARGDGLTSTAAESRRRAGADGPLRAGSTASTSRLLARQFGSPLVVLLIVAAVLAMSLGEPTDSAIILVVVVASGLLGFVQERRASNAVARLLALVRTTTVVQRDGGPVNVALDAVVPGDVVVLAAGDTIPGDCRLIEARDLFVDEAALTGESFPVEKRPGIAPADAPLRDRLGSVLLGTHVVSGTARALVVHTGRRTVFGHISAKLRAAAPETDFEHGIRRFGYLLLQTTVVLSLSVFAINVGRHRPVLESLLFTLALAVGLAPELLPAIVSVTLSHGASAMARARVIVKRLAAIEDLGAMTVLCLDKTGTITEGTVHLHEAVGADGNTSDAALRLAFVNASFESGFANPIDEAIRAAAAADLTDYRKLDEIPYDFVRKRLSVVVAHEGSRLVITKGALAPVLSLCTTVTTRDGTVPMDGHRAAIEAQHGSLSRAGWRTLAVASRRLAPDEAAIDCGTERDLTYVGLLTFADPPKADAQRTLGELSQLGVQLKLVTGDNALVAGTVARQVGMRADAVLTGKEMRELDASALETRALTTDIFAEVEPNQKERIIRALRATGQVVGFLGDGINDAAALHAADVGISVDSAADVTKQAADVVLLDKDLAALAAGLREGRRAFANTLKYIFITTSANVGNMVSMAAASLFTTFLPLLPKQILLVNFLTDLPSFAVATDRLDPELVARPRRWNQSMIRRFMLVFGLLSSAFDLLTFGMLLWILRGDVDGFRTGWFLESVLSEILVLLVIRTQRPFFRSRVGSALLWGSIGVAVATVAMPYTPLGPWFGLVPVRGVAFAALLGITALYVLAAEFVKRVFFGVGRPALPRAQPSAAPA